MLSGTNGGLNMPNSDGWNLSLTGVGKKESKPTTGETVKEVSRIGQRAVADADRFRDATSSSFYACLVFQSDEQRDAFVESMKWRDAQDPEDPCFLDGVKIAESIGVVLPQTPPERQTQKRSRWAQLAET